MKRFVLSSMLLAGIAAGTAAPAAASSITFHVQVSTAPLVGSPLAPFYLDFALNDGSGTLAGVNSVSIFNFNFGGGSPLGAPTLFGGASGNLSSSVSLTDNANFSNEFFQAFTPGIRFHRMLSRSRFWTAVWATCRQTAFSIRFFWRICRRRSRYREFRRSQQPVRRV